MDDTPHIGGGLTRKQAAAFLTEHGFPITERQVVKGFLPSAANPPTVDYWWGERALYLPDTLLRWAQGRVRTSRTPRRKSAPNQAAAPAPSAATPPKRGRGRPRKQPAADTGNVAA